MTPAKSLAPFRIEPSPPRVHADILARLLTSSPATLGHLTDFGFIRGLVPVSTIRPFAGSALTIRIPHADSTAVHHAMSLVRAGDVVVIDQSGDDSRSSFGGTLAAIALDAGAVAAISNGRTNDVREIDEIGFPVFSRGATPLTTRIHGFEGRIIGPVSIGGVVVLAGDIVFGDEDGVCVIPAADASAVSERLVEMENDPVTRSLRSTVRGGTPLGEITGAAKYFGGGTHE